MLMPRARCRRRKMSIRARRSPLAQREAVDPVTLKAAFQISGRRRSYCKRRKRIGLELCLAARRTLLAGAWAKPRLDEPRLAARGDFRVSTTCCYSLDNCSN